MTIDRDFDGITQAWLAEGPEELSDRVLRAVADEIHVTRQRRPLRLPWRDNRMSTPIRAATAAVIGVLVIGGVLFFARPGQPSVAGPPPSTTATPVPSATPLASTAVLSETFTSPRHGYSIRYPMGWIATPATRPWVYGAETLWGDPALDAIGTSEARLSVASQQLGPGQSADAWQTAYCGVSGTTASACGPSVIIGDKTGYVDEDGASAAGGTVVAGGVIYDASVVADGRGYEFTLDGHADRALFDELLASVTFDASSANDLPTLDAPFTSPRYGYSIGAVAGWTTTPGTMAWTGTDDSAPMSDEIAVSGTVTTVSGTSQPLPAGKSFDQWLTAQHADVLKGVPTGCDGGDPSTWPAIQIGPETGRLEMLCNAAAAFALVGGRVYEFDWGNSTFDPRSRLGLGSWKALLASVAFDPTSAK